VFEQNAVLERVMPALDLALRLRMLAELPTACDVGAKRNSKGYKETWIAYKLHIDVACGQIPVSCVLTSASVHDSQVAIALMTMTSARVSYLYDLMDAAYNAAAIAAQYKALGHLPLIDRNFRGQREAKAEWAGHHVARQGALGEFDVTRTHVVDAAGATEFVRGCEFLREIAVKQRLDLHFDFVGQLVPVWAE
jgi:hypothetical protein